jgi:hypothetical protein
MPEKLLRAFSKVYLQPGEERVVDLSAPVSDLTYYNVASNKMEILGGNYSIAVSNNSAAPTALRKSFVVR